MNIKRFLNILYSSYLLIIHFFFTPHPQPSPLRLIKGLKVISSPSGVSKYLQAQESDSVFGIRFLLQAYKHLEKTPDRARYINLYFFFFIQLSKFIPSPPFSAPALLAADSRNIPERETGLVSHAQPMFPLNFFSERSSTESHFSIGLAALQLRHIYSSIIKEEICSRIFLPGYFIPSFPVHFF